MVFGGWWPDWFACDADAIERAREVEQSSGEPVQVYDERGVLL